MKRTIRGILICFLAILLMSHNASAATSTYNLNDYDTVHFYPQVKVACLFTNVNNVQVSNPLNVDTCGYGTISRGDVWKLRRFYSYNSYPVEAGDIVEFYVLARSPNDSSTWSFNPGAIDTGSNLYYMMDYQQMATNNFDTDSVYYSIFRFTFKILSTGNWNFGFINANDYFIYQGKVDFSIFNISVYRKKTENDINKEQADATQNAADASETAGGSSASSSQQGTSSLLSAIGSAVSVISSASPTNCKLDADMGNFDMGEIDLCANPVPTFIQIIGSIILILMAVPLCITLFNRFIGLFRSFQS